MTFNEFIKALTPEQVNSWWDTIAPKEAPEKVEEENWKYKLSKNGKILPFKYTVSELAIFCEIDFKSKDFSSNAANRDAFCEAFDFEVIEDLVYDNTEAQSFVTFHKSLKQTSAIFQDASNYLHNIINNNEINPYKIRMALRDAKKQAMVIIGMRAVFAFREENGKARIAMILDKERYESNKSLLNVTLEEKFNGKPENKVLISFEISDWNEIPLTIIENHTKEFLLQYNSIKNTKRATWNTEANTTNSVLKYLLFKGENLSEWINKNNTKVYNMEFFNENEFELINKTQGKKYDKNNPVDKETYDKLYRAYVKLEYWGNEIKKQLFPNGVFKITKRPTNQGNHFDGYLWSKLYPSNEDYMHNNWIAITLGLDSSFHYSIKIDTVGLLDSHPKRQNYLKRRGDYFNSPLVKLEDYKTISSWDELIKVTVKDITELLLDFQSFKEIETSNNKKDITNSSPLNQILYGPPGTGKTYNTVLEAAKIVTGNEHISYDDALKVFKTNLDNQIEFITFHQNYSYEDFIQGLRPDTENGKDLSFEKKDGVFKRIADRAYENLISSNTKPEESNKLNAFLASLERLKEKIIDNEEPVYINETAYFVDVEENAFRYTGKNWTLGEKGFTGFRMKYSDLIELFKANVQTRQDIKKLNTISGLAKQHASYFVKAYQLILNDLKDTEVNEKIERKNYVIIIDEINRANISRVFGELITLIEEDKRSEGEIPMRVTLPSGDSFIVPSNLYIIGTMNTADKSIALLDVALRRRFEFKPMYPLYGGLVKTIHDADLLQKINEAILSRKNHDFTIGHAYFMGDKYSKEKTINNKVIPLLLEYFMNDEKEVIAILQAAGITIDGWPLKMI